MGDGTPPIYEDAHHSAQVGAGFTQRARDFGGQTLFGAQTAPTESFQGRDLARLQSGRFPMNDLAQGDFSTFVLRFTR